MLRTVARSTDVEPGQVRAFEIRDDGAKAVGRSRIPLLKAAGIGRAKEGRITLANVAGTVYAIDDSCTHRGCSLGDGKLDGTTVQCACRRPAMRRAARTSLRADASGAMQTARRSLAGHASRMP